MREKNTDTEKQIEENEENSEQESHKWTKQEIRSEIFSWIKMFIFVFAFTFVLRKYVVVSSEVPSTSMENLIEPGDRLIGFLL